jgi:choline dehydrogenase-like flavoprotein
MYYEPHASRRNLTVLTSAHVTRTSLSKVAGGEATAESVSFIYEGNDYRAFVKKEVILSAGYESRSFRSKGINLYLTISEQSCRLR